MMRLLRTQLLPVLVVLAMVFATMSASGESWPRFRGPNGTGIAADKDIPVEWNDKEGVLWKTAIPGLGNSSPIVWNDRIFLQSATEDGKQRLLLCVKASDGKILWTRPVPASKGHINPKNSLASSTCATDGERVYTMIWDGTNVAVDAFDFQGKHLWKQDLGRFTSQHGPATSPIVYGNKVFIANDQDGAAEVYAMDAHDGKIVWQAPRRPFRACYSVPFILEQPGEPDELIVASTAGITSYDPNNGKEKWSYTWTFTKMALRTVASPVYSDGLIFVNSGDGSGARHMIAVKVGKAGDVTRTNLVWEWKKNRPFPYVPTLLTSGEHLYFVNDRGEAGCVVAKTGEQLWIHDLSQPVSASPILIDGKIYTISEDGIVFVFPAATNFKLLAKNNMGEPVYATPAVADNRLYIRGKAHLFCIGKPSEKRAARE
ncbi:MAG TPA: PQQ-binding-like beta-propeller repeat protein [Gemmataceae bacterium]|nr:PQQ-binding-like beta-propeller repeat protein [Gemmataceae bacterium]